MLMSALWPDSGSNAKVHAKAAEVVGKVDETAKEMDLLKKLVYANYADWSQDPFASYGEGNVEFLERTARRYDSHGVFRKKVPGRLKLPAS